jgi:DNA-directed RNA polymerase I subunit RPA49
MADADLQTIASPDPASASSKRKKKRDKKSKAIDSSLNGESSAAAEDIDVAIDDPTSASSSKKKKKKKRQAIHASLSGKSPAAEDMDVTINDSAAAKAKAEAINVAAAKAKAKAIHVATAKAKAKAIHVATAKAEAIVATVDASLTGGSAAVAAPVVGYFPSGYDPLATGGDSPSTRLFYHPNRVDLVVRGPGGGPDLVGKSYTGEAAMPQLCNYVLGVLDKASGTLKVVPIDGDKVYASSR